MPVIRRISTVLVLAGAAFLISHQPIVHGQARTLTINPGNFTALRDWDNVLNRMLRAHELEPRLRRDDTLIPGRTIEQLDQYYNGVRVWGGSVSRQLSGQTAVSLFGALYDAVSIDVVPTISQDAAKATIERIGGAELGADRLPELVILPDESASAVRSDVGGAQAAAGLRVLF